MGLSYRVVAFEDRMPLLYGGADVCVTRAGALTVAELLVAGVPAILVPLPGAPRDHQTRNAEALVGMGAAVHLPDPECDGRRLAEELDAAPVGPRAAARHGAEAARSHAHPDGGRPVSPSWSTPMPADPSGLDGVAALDLGVPGTSTWWASAVPA